MALKIGMVDFGGWFYPLNYMNILAGMDDVNVVAGAFLADDDFMKTANYGTGRQEIVETLGIAAYDSIEAMAEAEDLDAMILFGEYGRKTDHIETAAACGVPLYTTKPPAVTMEQMNRIIAAGKTHNVPITVPEHTRFNGAIRKVRDRVRNGEIGELIAARVLHQHGHLDAESMPEGHWYRLPENGGPEVSLGWYCSGLLHWLVDSPPVRAYAEYDNFASDCMPHMDNGKATVRFANGVIGSADIYFSNDVPYPSTEVELIGTTGNIHLRLWEAVRAEVTVFTADGPMTEESMENDATWEEMCSWVRALRGEGEFEMPAEEASSILELCLAWKQSAATHQPVSLPMDK
ncbi:MAG: Gfo/Idh/MocA family protein [Planctomycetota bacterium]|jgi:myo-inositol 2-dehydrogenase/D-chiro-inositol 1-dehydrogenase